MAKSKDEKETTKQERIEVSIATPEEVEFYRAKYLEAMAAGPPKIIAKGFDITLDVLAVAMEGDSARLAVSPRGQVIRNGFVYDITGELGHLVLEDGSEGELTVTVKVRKSKVEDA